MTMPLAYEPFEGQMYQILTRYRPLGREWEHCDYADSNKEKKFLLQEYRLAYGGDFDFKTILLPQKYWPNRQ